MKVKILIGLWANTIGVLEDKIPNSNWFNVRIIEPVNNNFRLALTRNEFEILNRFERFPTHEVKVSF